MTQGSLEDRAADVVVVGGGMSGLAATLRFRQHGIDALVLEANSTAGGRVRGGTLAGQPVDLGAHWVGGDQQRIRALAAAYGVDVVADFVDRERSDLWKVDGETQRLGPDQFAFERSALDRLATDVEAAVAGMSAAEPWNFRDAPALDAVTFTTWLRERRTPRPLVHFLEVLLGSYLCAPLSHPSALYALWFIRGSGGLTSMASAVGEVLAGGAHQLANLLVADLGDRIIADAPVHAIDRTTDSVVVQSERFQVRAAAAIVAMAPADANRIRFTPELPSKRALLQRTWPSFPSIKVQVAYERDFWTDRGLNGNVTSDGFVSRLRAASIPGSSVFSITTFLRGHGAHALFGCPAEVLNDANERQERLVAEIARFLGEEALAPLDVADTHWGRQPYVAGASAPAPPGFITMFDSAIREPVGRIHWAGTESSTDWAGYMEGAVRAGERAADEVISGS